MAFPQEVSEAADYPEGENGDETGEEGQYLEEQIGTPSEARAMQAWLRILSRVLCVTMTAPRPPDEYEEHEAPEPGEVAQMSEPCEVVRTAKGHAQICLGDLMEESVTWIEVDSEDDCNSPKQADLVQVEEEPEEQEEQPVPAALKDIYRQQNAGGVVAGMQKCLSF